MSDADFTPHIRSFVIHGVGLIGGSLGMAAIRYGLADEVVGVGRDPARLQKAAALGAIHRYVIGDDCEPECAAADMIVLCTPVSKLIDDLPKILEMASENAVVTDVGSVKGAVVNAAVGDPRFVGSHPMAGSELAGVEAARADLFQDATWALTPTETTDPSALAKVRWLAQGVGANTRILTPELHDQAVAVTSHLPHILAYTLMALAAERAVENQDLPHMAAGSFAGATRVAASLPSLWMDIFTTNREAVGNALRDHREKLEVFQTALDAGDTETLTAMLELGYEAKRASSEI